MLEFEKAGSTMVFCYKTTNLPQNLIGYWILLLLNQNDNTNLLKDTTDLKEGSLKWTMGVLSGPYDSHNPLKLKS